MRHDPVMVHETEPIAPRSVVVSLRLDFDGLNVTGRLRDHPFVGWIGLFSLLQRLEEEEEPPVPPGPSKPSGRTP